MEPFKAKLLPIEYNIDKELLKLIAEANEKWCFKKLSYS